MPRWRWLLLFCAGMLAVQLGAARWPTHKDASAWTRAIQQRAPGRITQVDFVDDMARYGLHLHLRADVEKLSVQPALLSRFNPEFDETVADELRADFDPDALWITKQAQWPATRDAITANGFEAVVQGTPYQDRVLFRVRRAPAP